MKILSLKGLLIQTIYPFLRIYWFIVRPKTHGVRCVVLYQDKYLLVHHAYGAKKWAFPGGGMHQHEDPTNAISREVLEETGVCIKNACKIGELYTTVEYKKDYVIVFTAEAIDSNIEIDHSEIDNAGWFSVEEFPESVSHRVWSYIDMFREHK